MNGLKKLTSLLKKGQKEGLMLKSLVSVRWSSLISQSSNIELSYKLYPVNDHETDVSKVPLVFLHGLFGAKGNLHSIAKHLSSSGRRVVTYDARNHGSSGHSDKIDFLSMAEDLQDLIGLLAMKHPVVMGHSMGGKTAMTYALQNPGDLSSLIVADVAPQSSPGVQGLVKYACAMKEVVIPQNIVISKARRKVEVQLTPAVPERSVLQFLLTNLVETSDGVIKWRLNLDAFLNNPKAIGEFPSLNLDPFTKPTLFLFGADSAHYREADKGLIQSLFPSAQIEAIPNAGHFVHAEKPIEFVNIVQEFLKNAENS